MFCPKCGKVMQVKEGIYTCEAGNMPLSPHLNKAFKERFEGKPPVLAKQNDYITGWFCPQCGSRLPPGPSACESCGAMIGDLTYQLTEVHPHKK